MSDTVATTAAELLGGKAQLPKQKRPLEWPPDIKIRPAFHGAKYGWHPINKRMVKFADVPPANLDADGPPVGPKGPMPVPQQFAPAPAPEPVPPPPQPNPPTTPPAAETPPPPGPEPRPDFSDIGGPGPAPASDPQPGASQPNKEGTRESHFAMARMFFRAPVELAAQIWGPEWLPRKIKLVNPADGSVIEIDEEGHMVNSIVDALEYAGASVLNPVHRLYVNIGSYCIPRVGTIVRWWQSRKETLNEKLRNMRRAGQTQPANEPEADKQAA